MNLKQYQKLIKKLPADATLGYLVTYLERFGGDTNALLEPINGKYPDMNKTLKELKIK